MDAGSLSFPKERVDLCPQVWDNGKIKDEAKIIALSYVKDLLPELKLDEIGAKGVDIILTGSLAGYRYRDDSDFDLHILIDKDDFIESDELYLKAKGKELNAVEEKPYIGTHPIEIYLQPIDEEHHTDGMYSILKDKWLKKPEKSADVDLDGAFDIAKKFMGDIIAILEKYETAKQLYDGINQVLTKFLKGRKESLNRTDDVFNPYNVAFKMLRSKGVIDDIRNLKDKARNQSYLN